MKKVLFALVLSISVSSAFCQVDSLYSSARQYAFDGQYKQAQQKLNALLQLQPDHYDALFLQAMSTAWSGSYEPALLQLSKLVENFSPTEEIMEAMANIHYWAGDYANAIEAAEKGLTLYPENQNIRYTRAQALAAQQDYDKAISNLDTLLQDQAAEEIHPDAEAFKEKLEVLKRKNAIGLEYKHSRFNNTFTPWNQFTAYYQRKQKRSLWVGRLQYAQMFDKQGLQAEIDVYPKINKKTYAYLNAGISNATIFPKTRWGAEVFRLLPHEWEASLGMRGLYFQDVPIHIYTAQLGRYFPAYWISARAFMSTLENTTPLTGLLTARRYLGNEDHYTTLYVGSGATPIQVNSLSEIQRLNAHWIGIDYQHPLQKRLWLVRASAEFQQEEYPEIRLTDRLSFAIHLQRRF